MEMANELGILMVKMVRVAQEAREQEQIVETARGNASNLWNIWHELDKGRYDLLEEMQQEATRCGGAVPVLDYKTGASAQGEVKDK